jgi:hypothetical protein
MQVSCTDEHQASSGKVTSEARQTISGKMPAAIYFSQTERPFHVAEEAMTLGGR